MTLDTLGYVKRLEAAGVPRAQAEAQAEALRDDVSTRMATKSDIALVRADVASETKAIRTELANEAKAIRTELASEAVCCARRVARRTRCRAFTAGSGPSLV
jgi:hypothetical protein